MCVNNAIAFVKQFTLKEPSGVELKLICFRPDSLWKHTLPHLGQTQRSNTHLSKKIPFLKSSFQNQRADGTQKLPIHSQFCASEEKGVALHH